MQLKEFNILLDIKKYKKIEYIEVVKGDADTNVFNIQLLYDSGNYDLTGLKTEIVFSKPDGTTVLQDEENGVSIINNTEGKIQCTLKTNTIASGGRVMAEVRVLSVIDSRLLTSTRFEFFVRDSIVNDETIVSTNEFPILNQLIATTEGLIQQVELIESQVPAQVVTDLNAVSLLANQLNLDLVAHKAEKATQANLGHIKLQESWKTLPLQNGWVGSILYAKNDLGIVVLRQSAAGFLSGVITGLTLVATLPEGYRPKSQFSFPFYRSGSGDALNMYLTVHTDGRIRISKDSTLITQSSYDFLTMFYIE